MDLITGFMEFSGVTAQLTHDITLIQSPTVATTT